MRKLESGMPVKIGFDLLPVLTIIADFLAVRTDGDKTTKLNKLRNILEYQRTFLR